MLTGLHIRDFAVIDEVQLDFHGGLTVLTGETGAGKSILVNAVNLVLGSRGDSDVVREGAERAEVNAIFDTAESAEAGRWLEDQALDEDGECHLRRVIGRDGRSRGFINGRPAPIKSLRELGALLVELHGQHEHQSLLRRDAQRALLDNYAGNAKERAAVGEAYRRHRDIERRLAALPGAEGRDERADYLQYQVRELEDLSLDEAELGALEAEQKRLAHGQRLLQTGAEVLDALDGDDPHAVGSRLSHAEREIASLAELDPELTPVAKLLNEAAIQTGEAANELRAYEDALDLDPERLHAVEQRLGAAHDLARKHGVAMEELPRTLTELQTELDDLRNADARRRELANELKAAREAYGKAAKELQTSRTRAADDLNRDVTRLMETLGMQGGRFELELETDTDRLSESGTETVEFRVSTNAGQSARPLRKVASGGELSRLALAIQVATVQLGGHRSLIFDEVDAGIGGAVAEIVGARLRELGTAGQALCVTHLPQVAAQGHHHFRIAKSVADGATHTTVHQLTTKKACTEELMRMLGGVKVTEKTRAHAREMLEKAGDP